MKSSYFDFASKLLGKSVDRVDQVSILPATNLYATVFSSREYNQINGALNTRILTDSVFLSQTPSRRLQVILTAMHVISCRVEYHITWHHFMCHVTTCHMVNNVCLSDHAAAPSIVEEKQLAQITDYQLLLHYCRDFFLNISSYIYSHHYDDAAVMPNTPSFAVSSEADNTDLPTSEYETTTKVRARPSISILLSISTHDSVSQSPSFPAQIFPIFHRVSSYC